MGEGCDVAKFLQRGDVGFVVRKWGPLEVAPQEYWVVWVFFV